MLNLRIDPELKALIPPLRSEELEKLRDNIGFDGRILDPIIVWLAPEGLTIVDGHNRYSIYLEADGCIPVPDFEVLDLKTKDEVKAWMKDHQRGRRNLSPDQQLILDLQDGIEPAVAGPRVTWAKALLKDAPGFAEEVVNGTKTISQAYSTWRGIKATAKPTLAKTKPPKSKTHLVIGDTQVKPGVPTAHLTWIGRYIVDQFAGDDLTIIHLGDHWDMPSLSSYDKGKKSMEGRRYLDDIQAGNEGFALLCQPLADYNRGRKVQWQPQRHFLLGNHEDRICRAVEHDAQLEGVLSLAQLNAAEHGWRVHDFKEEVVLEGISYSHFFYQHNTGKPMGGDNLHTRLQKIGRSFTMGHQQGLQYALRPVGKKRHQGMVLGSTYLHDEAYLGPQANCYWRGIAVCHQVEDGMYDPMFVSLDYLCRRYEGRTLQDFLKVAA